MKPSPMMQLKRLWLLSLLFLILMPYKSFAAGFDFYFGGFSISATTASGSSSKSGLGAYKLSYQVPVLENLEFGLGYTLILSNTISGDAVFGIDLEFQYYPLTSADPLRMSTENVKVVNDPIWKPFVMMGYHQRQIQSVQTQYNGFGLGVGAERALDAQFNLKGLIRYLSLNGAREATATEIDFLLGLTFAF